MVEIKNGITFENFKKEAMQKLMKQFLSTDNTKDTVLTRKTILEMIKELDSISN